MLYINKEDVKELVDLKEMIKVIEKAIEIYESQDFVMPDRMNANYNNETYLYMPCFTKNVKGTKILTLYPNNASKNVPVLQGAMLLNDSETGKVKCILDGAAVTAYRTGAVGAVGIKYTTKENCETLGIIGTGVQGIHQCLYATTIRNIKKINIFDIYTEKAEEFKSMLSKLIPGVEINICPSTAQLVRGSDIIITVTTSQTPVIPDDVELLRGKHFIGIGSYKPNMREYPESLFRLLEKVYIDVDFAKEETGDLVTPLEGKWITPDCIETLGKAIKKGVINKEGTTFYKSVGMALFDIFAADYIYKKAVEKGIGQHIKE